MEIDFKRVEQSALKMRKEERVRLAERLLLSLELREDEEIEQAWREEVERRKKEVEKGEVSLVPFEEVQMKARRLLKK